MVPVLLAETGSNGSTALPVPWGKEATSPVLGVRTASTGVAELFSMLPPEFLVTGKAAV